MEAIFEVRSNQVPRTLAPAARLCAPYPQIQSKFRAKICNFLRTEHRELFRSEYDAVIPGTIDSAFSNCFLTMAPRYDHRTIQFAEASHERIIRERCIRTGGTLSRMAVDNAPGISRWFPFGDKISYRTDRAIYFLIRNLERLITCKISRSKILNVWFFTGGDNCIFFLCFPSPPAAVCTWLRRRHVGLPTATRMFVTTLNCLFNNPRRREIVSFCGERVSSRECPAALNGLQTRRVPSLSLSRGEL